MGLPNVGKSTLFNAVTQTRKALAANYRFCTIEPNTGVVTVPDERLEVLAKMSASQKIVPAVFEFVDIAGLVKGASKGEGLGNQFLGHIREVDAIIQVVRCFENSNIEHVMDTIDPVRDIEIINTELVLADLESVEKRKSKQEKAAKSGDKKAIAEVELLEKLESHLNTGKTVVTLDLTPEEKALVRGFFLLTAKPTLFACNVAEEDLATADSNKYVQQVRAYVKEHHDTSAVVVSAEIESELVTLPPEERAEYLAGLGVTETGTSNLIREAYTLLGLAHLSDHRRERDTRLDDSRRRQSAAGGGCDSLRFREELYFSRVCFLRRSGRSRLICPSPGAWETANGRQRVRGPGWRRDRVQDLRVRIRLVLVLVEEIGTIDSLATKHDESQCVPCWRCLEADRRRGEPVWRRGLSG